MTYDIIIAGAGIVGLAAGLKILEKRPGTKLLIIEKEERIASHQTGNNSGVIHSGIYYAPGSLKAKNCIHGYKLLLDFCKRENIEFEICGKVIVATNESELPALNIIFERGIANGLSGIKRISKNELKDYETFANGIEAIHVPYTGIIDYRKVSEKFAEKIIQLGGEIRLKEKLVAIKISRKKFEAVTPSDVHVSSLFVNCCGLYSDKVAMMGGTLSNLRIIPFRGEYYKLRKEKRHLVKNLIYPVPDPSFPFLGVHFTRMIDGEVEAGPNAVLALKREGYRKSDVSIKDSLNIFGWKGFRIAAKKYFKTGAGEFRRSISKSAFVKSLQKLLPEIKQEDLIKGGAGVRAQAVSKDGKLIDDFVIDERERIINVLNAPSPAATSSLSIGETIANLSVQKLN